MLFHLYFRMSSSRPGVGRRFLEFLLGLHWNYRSILGRTDIFIVLNIELEGFVQYALVREAKSGILWPCVHRIKKSSPTHVCVWAFLSRTYGLTSKISCPQCDFEASPIANPGNFRTWQSPMSGSSKRPHRGRILFWSGFLTSIQTKQSWMMPSVAKQALSGNIPLFWPLSQWQPSFFHNKGCFSPFISPDNNHFLRVLNFCLHIINAQ